MGMDFTGAEGAGRRDLGEADQGMHQSQLPWIVELEARDALAGRGASRLSEMLELSATDECLEDVLLDVEIIVIDRGELVAQRREVLDGFVNAVIGDVIGRRLGAQDQVVTDILLDEAVAVVAADDRVGQVHVFDLGLQLAAVLLADLATEDDRDFVRLADGAVGVEQALAELVESGSPIKDQVVAEFDLREEQPVLTAALPALSVAKERREAGQPLLAAARQIFRGQGVGQLFKPLGGAAPQEGVRALLEVVLSSRMRLASQ